MISFLLMHCCNIATGNVYTRIQAMYIPVYRQCIFPYTGSVYSRIQAVYIPVNHYETMILRRR